MMEPLDLQIRGQVRSYLDNQIDLDEFEEWLVANTWNIHQLNNPRAEDLTGAIEVLLAEYSSGDRTEDELREELDNLAPLPQVGEFSKPQFRTVTSGPQTVKLTWANLGSTVTGPAVEETELVEVGIG
jgi:hypothetical protein